MSIVIPDAAKVEWLKRALYGNAGSENLSLRLFKNNITPADSDVAGTYTVADFTGYSNVTLTSSQSAGTWAVPTAVSNKATSTYGTNATWTATSDQTVYGWYMLFSSSGIIAASQAFAGGGKALVGANSDQLTIVPRLQLDDF